MAKHIAKQIRLARQEEQRKKENSFLLSLQKGAKIKKNKELKKDFNPETLLPFFKANSLNGITLSQYFLKDPTQWKPTSYNIYRQEVDFIKYCFCKYRVPNFLIEEALKEIKTITRAQTSSHYTYIFGQSSYFLALSWIICLGRGESFRKQTKQIFSAKEADYFLKNDLEKELSLFSRIWWAKLSCLQIKKELKEIFLSHFVIRIFYFEAKRGLLLYEKVQRKEEFSIQLGFFLQKFQQELNSQTFINICDFFRSRIDEDPFFSLKGRTLASVIRLSNEWHADQLRLQNPIGMNAEWPPLHTIKLTAYFSKDPDGTKRDWNFFEITSGKELYKEGKHQSHCVGSYAQECLKGGTRIFSLRQENSTTRVTIELRQYGSNWEIVQARGKYNKEPSAAAAAVIKSWTKDHGFSLRIKL